MTKRPHGLGLFLAVILTVLNSIGGARAATILVDQQAASASDANSGTKTRPLKTIGAASKMVKPGDTVLVQPGTYREAVHLTVSGKENQPITFRSEVPYAAIIDGADSVTEFRSEGPGVWSFAAPDIAPLGHDANAGDWMSAEQVYVNDVPLEQATEKTKLTPGTFFSTTTISVYCSLCSRIKRSARIKRSG